MTGRTGSGGVGRACSRPGTPPRAGGVRRPGRDRDRGSGTVLALGLIAVLMVLTLAVVGLARAVHARGTAQTAADLGALAAAAAVQRPTGTEPCVAARTVVAANDAELTGCTVTGEVAVVSTAAAVAGVGGGDAGAGGRLLARATARAGPAP
ncbi:flp pilus-assembly TadE/G-like family protein [Georgenia sp. TF02-10]|uniref:Rv3654c family TadE-like protein n=1 Tax=Georgenia sp. TF02-10 TaxID=2917725 RepID=UPI001FA7EBB2|nr:Rv3654c family TadE-like protein [Georgenia sp. TF02-10]UNX56298.1 flp pilus-assembly TadE/G-like family protein [Georgenia sp. TF02-10]